MGSSQADKAASHERIVATAARRIRRDGIESLSVADLMHDAGLTHGAFYRHFGSRADLIDTAVAAALEHGSRRTQAAAAMTGGSALAAIIDGYLSPLHRDRPETGCAVAALATDVARAGTDARRAYTEQVTRYIEVLGPLLATGDLEPDRDRAFLMLAALVGATALARAIDDPVLSDEILERTARALHRIAP
jgi:TetR/AcrR family transcriptional regulator, transcriptional repressor for nem operon